jgi:transcriptional regulator with XRE-family HTH domain
MQRLQENGADRMKFEVTRKTVFAERLRSIMAERNLTVTTLARLVQQRIPDRNFNPVNLSHYRSGRSLPRPQVMNALAQALVVELEDLAPSNLSGIEITQKLERKRGRKQSAVTEAALVDTPSDKDENASPAFYLKDLEGGDAWIQINQRLSWNLVIKLLKVLKGEGEG